MVNKNPIIHADLITLNRENFKVEFFDCKTNKPVMRENFAEFTDFEQAREYAEEQGAEKINVI